MCAEIAHNVWAKREAGGKGEMTQMRGLVSDMHAVIVIRISHVLLFDMHAVNVIRISHVFLFEKPIYNFRNDSILQFTLKKFVVVFSKVGGLIDPV